MAQFLKLLSVLLLFAIFNPITCATYGMYRERRDRGPYIDSIKSSSQNVRDMTKRGLKKETTRYKQQSTKQSQQETKDPIVDQNIRSVFTTNFGPGLFLFNNTLAFVNQTDLNSYNDDMVGDQPIPYAPTPANDTGLFKAHRAPEEKDNLNKSNDKHRKEIFENGFQTNFPQGISSTNEDTGTSDPTAHTPAKELDIRTQSQEISTYDCLESDVVKRNKSFCSHLRNYPKKDHLEDLIKNKFPNLESFFGEDFVLPQNITQRMGNAPNEEYLCRSRVRVIYPKSAQNRDWNWIYIVNSSQYKQGIRVEECVQPYSACGENTGLSLPNRFTATCEQSYIYRSLIAYYNGTVFKDNFRIPSCCKCVLRSN